MFITRIIVSLFNHHRFSFYPSSFLVNFSNVCLFPKSSFLFLTIIVSFFFFISSQPPHTHTKKSQKIAISMELAIWSQNVTTTPSGLMMPPIQTILTKMAYEGIKLSNEAQNYFLFSLFQQIAFKERIRNLFFFLISVRYSQSYSTFR